MIAKDIRPSRRRPRIGELRAKPKKLLRLAERMQRRRGEQTLDEIDVR